MAHIFGSIWDRFNRNALNDLSKSVEYQGKSIQDLVAKGQLTPSQYAQLISIVNGNVSKGNITEEDLDKNNFKLDQTYLSDSLLQMIAGNTPINAVPADNSLTTSKYINKSVTFDKLNDESVTIDKLHDSVVGEENAFTFSSNRKGIIDYLVLVYDVGEIGLEGKNIKFDIDYIVKKISPITSVKTYYATGSTDTNARDLNIINSSPYTDDLFVNSSGNITSVQRYVHVMISLDKTRDSLLTGEISYTKAKVNGNVIKPVNYYIYQNTNGIIEHTVKSPNSPVSYKEFTDLTETTGSGKYKDKTIKTFGDSITWGTEGGYVKYLNSILGANIINHATSGARTTRLVGMMTHIKDRDNHSPTYTPNYTDTSAVTIMIGTNGGVTGSIEDIPYTPGQSVDTLPFEFNGGTISTEAQYWNLFPNNFYGNVALCIEYAKFKNGDMKIYLITPPHSDRGSWGNLPVVREAIIELGKLYSVTVIDAQENSGIDKKHLHKYSYDLTHLNELGNKLWGEYVAYNMLSH